MMMKMHSYLSTNGELAFINKKANRLSAELEKATEDEGGWDSALKPCARKREPPSNPLRKLRWKLWATHNVWKRVVWSPVPS